jgi:hypothetical protein
MILIFLSVFTSLFAPTRALFLIARAEPIDPFRELWEAVKIVESRNTEKIINYTEGAYGIAQIRQIKLNEYYNKTGKRYSLRDCLNEAVSKEIFYWHCEKYYTLELAAKRWNGSGPKTTAYWNKVKYYL